MSDWREYIDRVNCMEAAELLAAIPDGSVDMILTDPPYGTTELKWDKMPDLEWLWSEFRRVAKPNAAIVITAVQPFTSMLVMSNLKEYRYNWVWNKRKAANYLFGNLQPLKITEDVCVFYRNQPTYNPIKRKNPKGFERRSDYKWNRNSKVFFQHMPHGPEKGSAGRSYEPDMLLPTNLLEFKRVSGMTHPTQKSWQLFDYLIRTYTNPGELVLDCYMGSWTTGLAVQECGRHFIGSELDPDYCEDGRQRLAQGVIGLLEIRQQEENVVVETDPNAPNPDQEALRLILGDEETTGD